MKKNVIVIALAFFIATLGSVSYATINFNGNLIELGGGGDEKDKKKCSKSCKKSCDKKGEADRAVQLQSDTITNLESQKVDRALWRQVKMNTRLTIL